MVAVVGLVKLGVDELLVRALRQLHPVHRRGGILADRCQEERPQDRQHRRRASHVLSLSLT